MNSLITPRRWILHRVSTDILIIGSGVAGLRAGIEASEYGKVIIATKGKFSDGNTNEAQGGIAVVLSQGDTFTQHIQDTLSAGAGLCRKEAVEILTREGPERVKELFDWGAHFDSKEGDLLFTQEGGHSLRRVIHAQGDATGREIENTLFSRLYRCRNFRIWENAFAVELMVRDNTCYGAYLYTPKEGLYAVLADRVILSTGGAARVYRETTNHRVATGDGIAMVYRAGGELQDMEFLQFHPTALYVAGASRLLISEAVRGEGGILKNKYGERFMVKYHPQADLAPRDVVSRAILDEMKMTESTNVYLDVRGIPYSTLKKRFPNLASICKEVGLDIRRDLIPVRPSAHYTIGGVRVDLNGRTSIRNLFACGETASSGVHGANRLASNSLLEGLVFGYRVGKEAGISLCREIKRVKKIVYPKAAHHDLAVQLDLEDVRNSLKSLMTRQVGIEREADKLKEAWERINFWSDYILSKEFSHPEAWELQNMLTVASLIVKAALMRRESRGVHYRVDYPQMDDKNWRRHIVLQMRKEP